MSLKVIADACRFEPDASRGVVVIESSHSGPPFTEAFHELEGSAVVAMAQSHAASVGCAPAYLNGNKLGPYPVNAMGVSLENVKDEKGQSLPATHPRMQVARYRVDVPVTRPIR